MTKKKAEKKDELPREYDFSKQKGRVRGKYFSRYRAGTNLAELEKQRGKVAKKQS